MPTITKISLQKHQSDRYNVFIDGQYSLALSANELLALGLHRGQEVTVDELSQISAQAGNAKLYDLALTYLQLRRRSAHEVSDYLKHKFSDSTPMAIESVISRLVDNGLLDDREFARAWVADRNNLRPRSTRMLTQELIAKGIGRDIIEEILAEDPGRELEAVLAVAQKKLAHYPDQRKLTDYLLRQGFSYDLVKRAVAELT